MRKIFVPIFLVFVFGLFATGSANAEVKEFWNHISLEDTEEKSLDETVRKIWHIFEIAARDRGFIVKPNYKPFSPTVQTIMRLDTPLGELSHYGYALSAMSGQNGRVEKVVLSRTTDIEEPYSTQKNQIGYANGRLGEELVHWRGEKSVDSQKMSAWDLTNLDLFEGHAVEVPVSAAEFFFPEIKDLRLRFKNLYPQDRIPFQKITFAPGRLNFGSVLNTDIFISYWKDIFSGHLVGGELSWEMTLGEFATGEEIGLSQSFFYFMQENLSKAELIVPARKF